MTKILILDGGLGTTLEQNHDVTFDSATTPLWSSHLLVSDPETLRACQRDFGNVPVDILTTATYQVSVHGFANTKTARFPAGIPQEHVAPFLEAAVDIAEEAARRHPGGADTCTSIALSLGPYGACMVPSQEYTGRYDESHAKAAPLRDWHAERMRLFLGGVRDLTSRIGYIALETIPQRHEILAARLALARVRELSSTPFWISCLFPGDDERLPDGTTPEMAVRLMLFSFLGAPTPWGVGINCTKVSKLASLVERYEAGITKMLEVSLFALRDWKWPALVLYPDGTKGGEAYNTTTQRWEAAPVEDQASQIPWEEQLVNVVQDIVARGKWPTIVVGGCCMSKPDDIKRLRDALAKSQG